MILSNETKIQLLNQQINWIDRNLAKFPNDLLQIREKLDFKKELLVEIARLS